MHLSPRILLFAMSAVFVPASGAAVPGRPGLAARVDPTDGAASSATSINTASSADSSATSAPFTPTAVRPTSGYTVTETVTPSTDAPYNASREVSLASVFGWAPLSVIPTNNTACPPGFESATPTYTEILSTQVADPRHALGCCAGIYIRRDNPARPANFSAILNGTRDDGCFAATPFQLLELPYGVPLEGQGLTGITSFPVSTVLVTSKQGNAGQGAKSANPFVARAISAGLGFLASLTCLVGAAVVLL